MCPFLDRSPILQDNDVVSFLNGGEAMCDGNSRTNFRNPVKGGLDYLFALGINSASGFIEDNDLKLLDNAPASWQWRDVVFVRPIVSHRHRQRECRIPAHVKLEGPNST
jgi:hypothetical protein